eukprot:TRINITY_DN11182_c0_g1_i1.p1 TRINITY_DN11182_c0_g1~~TRINITY_DN11182_c0_g1_i1.p1  ORF type:complete len:479 (+),score=142.65 TRINITY_DN11182_c0_g1_i1:110-1546(+)
MAAMRPGAVAARPSQPLQAAMVPGGSFPSAGAVLPLSGQHGSPQLLAPTSAAMGIAPGAVPSLPLRPVQQQHLQQQPSSWVPPATLGTAYTAATMVPASAALSAAQAPLGVYPGQGLLPQSGGLAPPAGIVAPGILRLPSGAGVLATGSSGAGATISVAMPAPAPRGMEISEYLLTKDRQIEETKRSIAALRSAVQAERERRAATSAAAAALSALRGDVAKAADLSAQLSRWFLENSSKLRLEEHWESPASFLERCTAALSEKLASAEARWAASQDPARQQQPLPQAPTSAPAAAAEAPGADPAPAAAAAAAATGADAVSPSGSSPAHTGQSPAEAAGASAGVSACAASAPAPAAVVAPVIAATPEGGFGASAAAAAGALASAATAAGLTAPGPLPLQLRRLAEDAPLSQRSYGSDDEDALAAQSPHFAPSPLAAGSSPSSDVMSPMQRNFPKYESFSLGKAHLGDGGGEAEGYAGGG